MVMLVLGSTDWFTRSLEDCFKSRVQERISCLAVWVEGHLWAHVHSMFMMNEPQFGWLASCGSEDVCVLTFTLPSALSWQGRSSWQELVKVQLGEKSAPIWVLPVVMHYIHVTNFNPKSHAYITNTKRHTMCRCHDTEPRKGKRSVGYYLFHKSDGCCIKKMSWFLISMSLKAPTSPCTEQCSDGQMWLCISDLLKSDLSLLLNIIFMCL